MFRKNVIKSRVKALLKERMCSAQKTFEERGKAIDSETEEKISLIRQDCNKSKEVLLDEIVNNVLSVR